jgi:glycosyltransferase involved in cell wall biosynthesis
MKLSVVIPVFNSENKLHNFVESFNSVPELAGSELIFVDDGSSDASWSVIAGLSNTHENVLGLRLAVNSGQHAATLAGIRCANGTYIATIDDDLQFAPRDIPLLMQRLQEGGLDLIYGIPELDKNSRFRRLASRLNKVLLNRLIGVSHAEGLSSFRLFKKDVTKSFESFNSPGFSLDALLSWGAASTSWTQVRHNKEKSDKSRYDFGKLLSHALDVAVSFSVRPLRWISLLGFLTAVVGFLLLFGVLHNYWSGSPEPGFSFLATAITFFAGVQLVTIGVLGEYVGRIHLASQGRDAYTVVQVSGSSR